MNITDTVAGRGLEALRAAIAGQVFASAPVGGRADQRLFACRARW
jgi:hypothetical protein